MITLLARDVEVGDEANGVRTDGAGEDVAGTESGDDGWGVSAVSQRENDDVALHGVEVDLDFGDGRNGFGEEAGVAVILVEAGGHLLKGDEAGGGEDAGLAHAATERLADRTGAINAVLGADEHGADRGAETLGQAEVDRGEAAGDFGDGQIEGGSGVEDARSIEMNRETGLFGASPDGFEGGERSDGAAGHIVRVFDTDETGGCAVVDLWRDGGREMLPGEDAARRHDGAEGAAGEVGDHAHLPVEHMGAGLAEDLLPVLGVELDGDLVAHGAGGHEDGGLALEDLGGGALEAIDGGIFRVDIVADLGRGHGLAHGGGGLGNGVAAKIDWHGAETPKGDAGEDCFDLRADGQRTLVNQAGA